MSELDDITHNVFPGVFSSEMWEEEPVSPKDFFDRYLKEPAYPKQLEFVEEVLGTTGKGWDETYNEGIALVGKGGGKDRTNAKMMVYLCYKLLCMRNPQRFLELGVDSAIDLGNVSLNSRLARDVFFKNFRTLLKHVKNPVTGRNWFTEKGIDLNKSIQTREVKFPKSITVYSLDSEEYTGEGLNLLVVVFDEVGGFPSAKAEELYDALKKTQRSRYPQKHKTLLISYPREQNDFMMIRYNQAPQESSTYRVRAATWDWNITKKKEDFIEDYVKDAVKARRVYECLVTAGENTFIYDKEQLVVNFTNGRENPCLNEELWTDNLLNLKFKPWFVPEVGRSYFVHVDLAKGQKGGDCAGFALGHYKKDLYTQLTRRKIEALKTQDNLVDVEKYNKQMHGGVIIDLALQLRAREGKELEFEEIRHFIISLKERGFRIKKVTYDGWQSVGELQMLNKAGFNAETQSVDKDRIAYDTLKDLILKGVFPMYKHPILQRELDELVKVNEKVDHPPSSGLRPQTDKIANNAGSKDVSDATAGVVRLCQEEGPFNFSAFAASVGTVGTGTETKTPEQVQMKDQEHLIKYGERPKFKKNW